MRLERAIRAWPDDGSTRAILARTNRELLPAVSVALQLDIPFRAPRIDLPIESPHVDELLRAMGSAPGDPPLLALGRVRALLGRGDPGHGRRGVIARGMLGVGRSAAPISTG